MTLGKKLGVLLLTVLPAALLTGCAERRASAQSAEAAVVETLEVRRGQLTSTILLTGELKAQNAVPLIAPNANIWPLPVRWVAEDGIEVDEGERVVEFDTSQLSANLDQMAIQALEAYSELESAIARVAAEIDEAEFELERQKSDVAKARLDAEVPARLQADRVYEERQLTLKEAELELEGARRRLENARAAGEADVELARIALARADDDVRQARASIAKLSLIAPRAGILILSENPMEGRPVRAGDSVWPGMRVAELPELETLAVEARLFDVDDGRVEPGQSVRAWLDAFPDREYRGRVREVDDMANQVGRFSLRRFFTVRIDIDDVDAELMRPGMSVKLLIEAAPVEDALLIPRAALDWSDGEPRAMTVGGRLTPVELGPCNTFHCVLVSGLEEGDALDRPSEVL